MAALPRMHSSAAPAGRKMKAEAEEHTSKRPQLRVVDSTKSRKFLVSQGLDQLWKWTKTRTTPMVYLVVAVVFLVASLLGSLMLRTQMIQDSFEATQVQRNITTLTQDVEDDQAKLDQLEASLPQRAEDMKMIPATNSVTIDLQGYKPSQDGTKK